MKNFPINNLFNNVPVSFPDEFVDILSENKNVRIERIVSKGHASPENFWYDQDKDEFVILLKGSARLAFKDEQEIVELKPGDYLHIRAHVKHRVEWTST
ncbi:MAG: cupin domain-containing protein, partial [Proteobacteria bacterium]|nr:cupin domain-containing protein [Pseudomonadota bacterium]